MKNKLKLGLNLSHDASVALCDDGGNILFALQEERITRKKNTCAFPKFALDELVRKIDPKYISEVIVGGVLFSSRYVYLIFEGKGFPSFNYLHGNPFPPHFEAQYQKFIKADNYKSSKQMLDTLLQNHLITLGINAKITYRNHHASHVASALIGSGFTTGLAISLDGHGDNESGRIKKFNFTSNYDLKILAEVPKTDSLGMLYSAVTQRYNFKSSQHEGKITGLAAFGESSPAVEFLMKYVQVKNGIPEIKINSNDFLKVASRIYRRKSGKHIWYSTFDELVEQASSLTINYGDLAFAIQKLLEDIVLEVINHWTNKTNLANVALAGGVFANVKVNQKIAELNHVDKVFVFPNMGDGGLAVGAIWDQMLDQNCRFSGENKLTNVYLDVITAQDSRVPEICANSNLQYLDISENWVEFVSDKIVEKKILGVIQGKMEFGPRALLNRSIIADPTIYNINNTLNKKLRRTEFMPFAPACLIEDLSEIFDVSGHGSWVPFEYMTMTCNVKDSFRSLMPAVVHIDGTARPQAVSRLVNPKMWETIKRFKDKTGIPTIINTSFNAHEEPIVRSIEDGILSLIDGSIDFLITENYCLYK